MDIEKATLKKAAVSILPLWADPEAESKYSALQTIRSGSRRGSSPSPPLAAHTNDSTAGSGPSLKPIYATASLASHGSLSSLFHHHHSASSQGEPSTTRSSGSLATAHSQQQLLQKQQQQQRRPHTPSTQSLGQASTSSTTNPDWSVFATMSNVSTLSNQLSQKMPLIQSESETLEDDQGPAAAASEGFSLRRFPPKLDELFKSKSTGHHEAGCTCTCPGIQGGGGGGGGRSTATSRKFRTSKRRQAQKDQSVTPGYPTGQCESTEPPEDSAWDEKDDMGLAGKQTLGTNRTFNTEVLKGFINSPFFSNVLKSLTVMAAVSVFAIALDSIVLLVKTPDQKLRLVNDNACMIITVILSVLTIAYSVFNIFLESRRPPEGLDTTRSKPLTVIISEIVASILWSQILSITIYMYTWTYGCTSAGQEQLDRLWRQDAMPDPYLQSRLCRRQGAIVGLEALLVLLLIFNFCTHIEQNFKFIRAVS